MEQLLIIAIITMIICTYVIITAIKNSSPEGQNKKLLKKIGAYKNRLVFIRSAILEKEPDLIENDDIHKLRVSVVKMDEKYHSLVDRNISDRNYKKILELTEDWNEYLTAIHSLKMTCCKLVVDPTSETAENYGELTAEPNRKKKEIEKKFNSLLKQP